MKLASDAPKHLLARMVCHSSSIPWRESFGSAAIPSLFGFGANNCFASDFGVIPAPPTASLGVFT